MKTYRQRMKLHLGCGQVRLTEYLNIDIRYLKTADLVCDAEYLDCIKNESVIEIYACHILEHFPKRNYKRVLKSWHRCLKPNGIIKLCVPDFDSIVTHYLSNKDLKILLGAIYGGQQYKENSHYMCWNFETLKKDLIEVGFNNVKKYTPHCSVNDYSKSCFLLKNKKRLLMSINVQATKD